MTRARDQSARRYLIEQGLLEAVFELPAGVVPYSTFAASLWVLRQPSDAMRQDSVLLVDVAPMIDSAKRPSEISENAIAALAQAVDEHRDGMPVSLPFHVAVTVDSRFLEERAFTLAPSLFLPSRPVQSARPKPRHRLLTRVGVGGFKSFDSEQLAEIRPVTLVYGANSAGKSSLIQSLLLLKQSTAFPNIVMQGPVTDAGSFVGALHAHNTEREVAFSISFGSAETWPVPPAGVPDPSLERHVRFRFGADPSGLPQFREIGFSCGTWNLPVRLMQSLETAESQMYVRTEALESAMVAWDVGSPIYSSTVAGPVTYGPSRRDVGKHESARRHLVKYDVHEIQVGRDGLLPSDSRPELPRHAYTSERARSTARSYIGRGIDLIAGISSELRQMLGDLTYLGPLRSAPQRFYDRTAVSGDSDSGGRVALYLFDHESETRQVNEWLQRLGVPYAVRVAPLASTGLGHITGDLVTMVLTDLRSGIDVSPNDVGFGVSQVLPVVVEALARSNSVICIEQPEIHLHPALQTSLGDLFIESSAPTGRANQLIVETHSEHLVLRIQRRVREGVIDADDVSILYVDQDANGSAVVTRLRLDGNGDFIDEWPRGFFDERLGELFGGVS